MLIQTLRELESSPHEILAVFTVQEEVGVRGATTAGYGLEPEIILAIDVTATGDFPQATPMEVALGKGAAIKVMDRGMIAHPKVRGWLEDTAQAFDIPYQLEVLAVWLDRRRGGTGQPRGRPRGDGFHSLPLRSFPLASSRLQ